jgi:hypothetical protein
MGILGLIHSYADTNQKALLLLGGFICTWLRFSGIWLRFVAEKEARRFFLSNFRTGWPVLNRIYINPLYDTAADCLSEEDLEDLQQD